MNELAELKNQGDALKNTEAEMREQCRLLQEQLQDQGAEKMLLEVELKRKNSDHEETLEKFHRLNEEIERRVKEKTRELEQACSEMRKLDELKDSFLSSVSHELRTPLTSIRSFSEILLNYDDVDPESQREFLQIINLESERLTRLINDVLDLSKIESGNMVWHDDLISLKQVIEDAAKVQAPLLRKKSLELTLDLSVDLPLVFADRDRVHQVVINILGNAVKFSPDGSKIRVRAEKHWSGDLEESLECIKVSVSDEGKGIAHDDLTTIFNKFQQATADTLQDKPEGTGLGLPICREIIGRYKGDVWVESEVGKGSTFFFTLPVSPLSPKDTAAARPQDAVQGWRGKSILVVDDNRNVRRVLRYQFQKRGYTVLEAASGREAIDLTRATHIDMITLDLMMPTMSGYDVLKMIRENRATCDIPVLVISVVEDREKGILLGANDCLGKPFAEDDLIKKVRSLLGEEKKSILVVDDEVSVLEILRMRLGEMGFPVDTASDGEEAIQTMKDRVPDLLILDVLMPGKNGYEVLNWVRNEESTSNLPVIMISGCPIPDDHIKLLNLGAEAVVEKSENLGSLFEKIDAMVMTPGQGSCPGGGAGEPSC